jgi:hypothetical protein
VCVQEVTNRRTTYPKELAGLYAGGELVAELSNRTNGTDLACVDLPMEIGTAGEIRLGDQTDPAIHNNAADGYDVDWIGACYLYLGDETAWGAACYEGDGTRFTDGGSWGTYFPYTIESAD